jgi:16S rRNA (cytosine1407-C5)-methyltransferase
VLDLAAAPGGKTLQLAAAMENQGRIAAVEPVKGRFHRLRANLDRCGVTIAALYLADGRAIGAKVPGRFDRVLLDAPCSSEARIRLDAPATYEHWKLRKIRECARKQQRLLLSAFDALKPDGQLLYSTCAFAPEENERVVAYLLERRPAADVLPLALPTAVPAVEGLTSWHGKPIDGRLSAARRIVPDDVWDGFFLCLLTRRG